MYIGDVIARWEKAKKSPNRTLIKQVSTLNVVDTYQPEIFLKKMFYYSNFFDEQELFSVHRDTVTKRVTSCNTLLLQNTFYQFLIDIKKQNILITTEEAAPLAACFSASQRPESPINVTEEQIHKCFPRSMVESKGQQIIQSANENYKDYSKFDSQDAMIEFIKLCYKSSFFGSIVFSVNMNDTDYFLAVFVNKILLIKVSDLSISHKINFDEIATITPTSSTVKITYGNLMQQDSIQFNSYQGDDIVFAYNKYLKK